MKVKTADLTKYRRDYMRVYRKSHKKEMSEWRKIWWAENRDKHIAFYHKRKQETRVRVLTHYSNGKLACVRCGFDDIRALSIDHMNNDGYKMRKDGKGYSGIPFYVKLINSNYPEGYQTLCMNCQFIKRWETKAKL